MTILTAKLSISLFMAKKNGKCIAEKEGQQHPHRHKKIALTNHSLTQMSKIQFVLQNLYNFIAVSFFMSTCHFKL